MPIIRITKEHIVNAQKARKEALEKDSDFKRVEDKINRLEKEVMKQRSKEVK